VLGARASVREGPEQLQRRGEVRDLLLVSVPPPGRRCCLLPILHRPPGISPLLKVYGQDGGARALLIARLLPFADPAMQVAAPARRQPLVHDLWVQSMQEAVAGGHGPIRPGLGPARLQKLSLPG
jgi:hypothetical protein